MEGLILLALLIRQYILMQLMRALDDTDMAGECKLL